MVLWLSFCRLRLCRLWVLGLSFWDTVLSAAAGSCFRGEGAVILRTVVLWAVVLSVVVFRAVVCELCFLMLWLQGLLF